MVLSSIRTLPDNSRVLLHLYFHALGRDVHFVGFFLGLFFSGASAFPFFQRCRFACGYAGGRFGCHRPAKPKARIRVRSAVRYFVCMNVMSFAW